ncbi:hypothetical protein LINPERPRIM_LOCUS32336 [Linum perenne]
MCGEVFELLRRWRGVVHDCVLAIDQMCWCGVSSGLGMMIIWRLLRTHMTLLKASRFVTLLFQGLSIGMQSW